MGRMESYKYICSKLLQHYKRLEERLDEVKKEYGCEPLCEDRYSYIRNLAIIVEVFDELVRALGCI